MLILLFSRRNNILFNLIMLKTLTQPLIFLIRKLRSLYNFDEDGSFPRLFDNNFSSASEKKPILTYIKKVRIIVLMYAIIQFRSIMKNDVSNNSGITIKIPYFLYSNLRFDCFAITALTIAVHIEPNVNAVATPINEYVGTRTKYEVIVMIACVAPIKYTCR